MHVDTPATSAAATAANPTRRYQCRHVFTDGHRCGSPSLRGQDLCYYHTRTRHEAPCAGRTGHFAMARIDDRGAVQIALYDVLSRMAGGDIDVKLGTSLLYGLQIASSNLGRPQPVAEQPPQVEEVTSDYNLGDLAPIVEYYEPEPAAEAVAPAETPTTRRNSAAPAPPPAEREYTPEEREFLKHATSIMGTHFTNCNLIRPASLTDGDIETHINEIRRSFGYGPIPRPNKPSPPAHPTLAAQASVVAPESDPQDRPQIPAKPVEAGTRGAPLPQPHPN
jgi:hypothetical protein